MKSPSSATITSPVARDQPLAGRLGRAIVVVLAAATIATWLQTAAATFLREVLGAEYWKWWLRDQILLSTAGYLMLFTVLGTLPVLVHLLWPRRYPMAALTGTLAGLAAFCGLLVFERIAWWAWLIVATGAGLRVHHALDSRAQSGWRWIRGIAVLGHAAAIVVFAVGTSRRMAAEAASLAALPAAAPGAPNVLLLVMDTERAESMSLYGAPDETTPRQAAWGARGVVFDAAHSTAPWTLPSHASMFTGRYPSQTGADWTTPLDPSHPTMTEAFQAHGYSTAGFVANINYTGYRSGLARGFAHYEDARWSLRQVLLSTTLTQSLSIVRAFEAWDLNDHWVGGTVRALWPPVVRHGGILTMHDIKLGEEVSADFLEWLPSVSGRPFFAFLNFMDAHEPYVPPMAYRTMFGGTGLVWDRYRGAIRYLDDTVDQLLAELDRRGLLESTIVVITSDHGDLFGEHGRRGHGNGLYPQLLHVPLVVLNAPGAVAGTRVRQPVSLRDLPATLLDLAAVPRPGGLGGTSLRPLLSGASEFADASPVLAELSARSNYETLETTKPALAALIQDSLHVVESALGEVEFFAPPGAPPGGYAAPSSSARQRAAVALLHQQLATQGIAWKPGPGGLL